MRKPRKSVLVAAALLMTASMLLNSGQMAYSATKTIKGKKIKVGSTCVLTVKQKAKWKIKGNQVARLTVVTPKRAEVTGLKQGKTTVTAKAGKKKYKCKITVKGGDSEVESANRQEGEQVSMQAVAGTGDAIFYTTTGAQVTGHFDETYAATLIAQTNSYRAANGLGTLTVDPLLTTAAQIRAYEAAVSFSHTRPNGEQYYTVNSSVVYGENLAYGYSTAELTMTAWQNSQTHNENLLRGEFGSIGMAVCMVKQADGSYIPYIAQEFGQ